MVLKKIWGGGGRIFFFRKPILTNSKTHYWCIFSKLSRYVHFAMGVCCVVFDIDEMLFEFFMIFFNIEKK